MKNYPVPFKKNEIIKKEEISISPVIQNDKYKNIKLFMLMILFSVLLGSINGIYSAYKSHKDWEKINKDLYLKYGNR